MCSSDLFFSEVERKVGGQAAIISNASSVKGRADLMQGRIHGLGVKGCEVNAKRCKGFALGVTVVSLTHQAVKTDGRDFPSAGREKACCCHGV